MKPILFLLFSLLPLSLWAGYKYDGQFTLEGKLGDNINFAIIAAYQGNNPCIVVGETRYTRQNGKVSTIKLYGTLTDNYCYLREMVDNQVCGNFNIEMPTPQELSNPQLVNNKEVKGTWLCNEKELTFNGVHLSLNADQKAGQGDLAKKFLPAHSADWRHISGQYGYWDKSFPDAESYYKLKLTVENDSVYWHSEADNEMCSWVCNFTTPGLKNAQKNEANCFSPVVDGGQYRSIILRDAIFLERTNEMPEETDNFVNLDGIYPKIAESVNIHKTRSFDPKNEEAVSYVDVSLEVPIFDSKRLNDSIHAWVADALSHGNTPSLNYWELAEDCADGVLEGFAEPMTDDDGNMELWQLNNAGRNVSFSDYESKKFINLSAYGYDYMGGAHPFSYSYTHTIRRSDGKVMRYNDWFTNLEKVRAIVEKYMRKLEDVEYDYSVGKLPLPDNLPSFSHGHFYFEYQQYEVAPYCYGMPQCEIPVSVLMPYLTPAAKTLVK